MLHKNEQPDNTDNYKVVDDVAPAVVAAIEKLRTTLMQVYGKDFAFAIVGEGVLLAASNSEDGWVQPSAYTPKLNDQVTVCYGGGAHEGYICYVHDQTRSLFYGGEQRFNLYLPNGERLSGLHADTVIKVRRGMAPE